MISDARRKMGRPKPTNASSDYDDNGAISELARDVAQLPVSGHALAVLDDNDDVLHLLNAAQVITTCAAACVVLVDNIGYTFCVRRHYRH